MTTRHRRLRALGRGLVVAVPTVWLLVFFLAPFLVVAKISLADAIVARPPYTPLFQWTEDAGLTVLAHFRNYRFLLDDSLYAAALFGSLRIALVSTAAALLVGYPMAWCIARAGERRRNLLLVLVILPFWTSFLLRVYAWIGLLQSNGLVNGLLLSLGIVSEPLVMLQTSFAVYLGIVYTYLPFMVLPLYANLVRLDGALLEAAADLGSRPAATFFTVVLPLSMPGVAAGCMLVALPAAGEFVIPALLGGPDTLMIGRVLWDEFFLNRDWPVASAVAIAILAVLVAPLMLLRNARAAHGGGAAAAQ